MTALSRSEIAGYAVCAVLIALLGARALSTADGGRAQAGAPLRGAAVTGARTQVKVERTASAAIVVHVVGAVRRPGVYRLVGGARIEEALRRAGGARRGADLTTINLAAKVLDGQQIAVGRRGASRALMAAGTAAAAGVAPAPGAAAAGPAPPLDLNTAGAEQLETLDGVGPATAAKILEFRSRNGGFRSVQELTQVPGIGPKRLAAMRPRVRV